MSQAAQYSCREKLKQHQLPTSSCQERAAEIGPFVFSADPSDFLITMRTTLLFASRFASDTACGEIAIFRQRSVISDSMLYYRGVTASS